MSEQDDQERNEAPTQKRLDDARAKGDVAKSTEISAAISYIFFLIAMITGSGVLVHAAEIWRGILIHSDGKSAIPQVEILQSILFILLLLFSPGVAVILSMLAQRNLVFAPDKLMPQLSRVSPIANAKQKFGADGMIEFIKNIVKMCVVATVLTFFLLQKGDLIVMTIKMDATLGLMEMVKIIGQFLLVIAVLTGCIGGIDLIIQHQSLLRRNQMSRKDMQDEMKESEGDPHAKATRRQRGQEIAMNQMLNDVSEAAVIVVNPTHYAVALKWKLGADHAPIVVAKGVDEIAMRIRERATEAGIPIHSDPPTARAIHATVEIGQPIDRKHYQAVAAAIRFADIMRRKMKGKPNA